LIPILLPSQAAAPLEPPDKKVGVLLIGYGEPESYDADAYTGWKNFLQNYMGSGMKLMQVSFAQSLIEDKLIPLMDFGTLLVDKDDPFAKKAKKHPQLIDAWGRPYKGKNYHWISLPEDIPMMEDLSSLYRAPGGPGRGEPDFWEYLGLQTYGYYQEMGNYNPGEKRELRIMDETEKRLKERYGDNIVIHRGFGAARPGFPDFRKAAAKMVREGVTDLVLAEAYICQSDFEHPAGEVKKYLKHKKLKANTIIADQIGGTESFSLGVARKAVEELKNIPQDSDVVVFLSHHGMYTLNMLLYDWSKESYHEHAKITFEGAKRAIYSLDMVKEWQGRLDVWQVYAEFGEGMMDPDDKVLGVEEAADLALEQGYKYCVDIPYGVGNSGYETLIGLRGAWGLEPPAWEEYYQDGLKKYRTETEYDGLKVVITDGWIDGTSEGYYAQIVRAIDGHILYKAFGGEPS
jgi:hypothetical protein